jgi:hypothetical protein
MTAPKVSAALDSLRELAPIASSDCTLSLEKHFEDTPLDDSNWPMVRLGEVATISAGNSAPQGEEHYLNGLHPFFRTSDVGSVHLSNNLNRTRDKLTEKGASGISYPLHQL